MGKDIYDMMVSNERINSKLLDNHIYFLSGEIDTYSIEDAIKWIMYENLDPKANEKTLTLYINTEGGSLNDALALIDVMRQSDCKIKTIGIGSILSAGFLIFACGTKGLRLISKNTSIMIHQYSSGLAGKQHDIEAYSKEMSLTKSRIINILNDTTNLDIDDIKSKLIPPSDVWLTPEELLTYGIADEIV